MKDRCPKSVGDAKESLEIRVELRGAVINIKAKVPNLCDVSHKVE